MSVRKRSIAAGGLSLFPFLAVLICVMGALIVLLVVLARHARVQATRSAQKAVGQKKISLEEIQQQREMLQWQAEQIQESRAKTEAQLAEARLQLGGAEEHLRKLREEAEKLKRAWQALDQAACRPEEIAQLENRLRQLEAEIIRTKSEVDRKNQLAQQTRVSYAVIPYQGPYGTTRRPIYIECRQDAVILQPEGVVLGPRDFEGPMTPEHPLARAVRAIREYWAAQADPLQSGEEPYPLLLVRPDGIAAYYAARDALQGWRSEFGYELVGQDWQLKFPPADPRLAQVVQEEVRLARARQEVLAKIAPRIAGQARPTYRVGPRGIQLESGSHNGGHRPQMPRFGDSRYSGGGGDLGEGPEGLAGSPGGGNSPEGVSGEGPGTEEGAWAARRGQPARGPGGTGSAWSETASRPTDESEESGLGQSSYGSGRGDSFGSGGSGRGGPMDSLARSHSLPQGQSAPGATAGGGSAYPSPNGLSGPSSPAGPQRMGPGSFGAPAPNFPDAKHPEGSFSPAWPGVGGAASSGAQDSRSSSAMPGRALRPGEWYDRPPETSRSGTDLADSSRSGKKQPGGKQLQSLRGRNWALPDAAANAIPITRPIPVECYADRLVIAPQGPGRKEIRLGSQTLDHLDEFVGGIWDHMDRWGIAGRGMYWRPVLTVRVAPGAEARFQELQTLLEESGLVIERAR